MDKQAKDAIRELVLDLRETLEAESERELGRYGIYADRSWIDANDIARLSAKERDQDRPRIEAAIKREQEAGPDLAEAVRAFIRETAYTHMNRLLGLKCMEARGLIDETISTHSIYSGRSKRHRDYLDEHPEVQREADRGLVAMLQQAHAEVSQHIGVVFDPDSDYSIVWPRHTVLKDCIASINAVDEEVASKLGEDTEAMASVFADDTVLGWVYQYFQEREKTRVFAELREKGKKIGGYDIIPATTIYTERYMVQFLVENSLGALWMEMYPDSDQCERWEYYVEDPNLQNEDGARKQGREPRPVAELTLLDPACGSGHFLLYAFDLLAEMYEAEAEMQGQPVDQAEIARRILRHNLYAIDIDLRSIQLSALSLYMKACTYAGVHLDELQNSYPVQMNLVCADIVLHGGNELKELLALFKDDHLTQDLIKTIWRGLENARELGSLLKVEDHVDEVIARKRIAERDTFWEHPEELWEQWKRDFLKTLKDYADRATEAFDVNRRMFGQEAIRGVQLLDLLTRRYDVVTTNPPYMGSHRMGSTLLTYVKAEYSRSSRDLYSCFIERCTSLSTSASGYAALVTMHGFMFLSSFGALREYVLTHSVIRSLAHLGDYAFEVMGDHAPAAMYALRSTKRPGASDFTTGVFLRLVDQRDKSTALLKATHILQDQRNFSLIDKRPWLYWVHPHFYDSFRDLPPLDDGSGNPIAMPRRGLDPRPMSRFVRHFWEVPNAKGWVTYTKGGDTRRWYGNREFLVAWGQDGSEIKDCDGSIVPNEDLYFGTALTYSRTSGTGLNVRAMENTAIMGCDGPGIFSDSYSSEYLAGFLNSSLAGFLIHVINPTLHYQTGDVARLPFKHPLKHTKDAVEALAADCMKIALEIHRVFITEPVFQQSALATFSQLAPGITLNGIYRLFQDWVEEHEVRISLNEAAIDGHIFALYEVGGADLEQVLHDQGIRPAFHPILAGYETVPHDLLIQADEHLNSVHRCTVASQELVGLKGKLSKLYVKNGKAIEEISAQLGINPVSVVSLRREMGLVNPGDLKHEVENLLSHRTWELCERDEDGIIPYDDGLQNPSLLEQVRGEIEAVFGPERAVAIEAEMDGILGRGGLERWLENPFFKKHVSQFKKRPILWQIASPNQHFRVLVYYNKLDHDTLPKIRSQYLWPLLERAKTRLRATRRQDPPNMKTIGDLEAYIADLEKCDELLESVIEGAIEVDLPDWAKGPYRDRKAPYNPDLDDGVKVNILPLQAAGLLPMKKVV